MVVLGVIAANKREKKYDYYPSQWVAPGFRPGYWTTELWVYAGDKNWLFNGDTEIFIGIGAAIWLLDVAWVASRGTKNIRRMHKKYSANSSIKHDYRFSCVNHGLQFNYTFTF